jgi:hypothetical protein
MFTIIGVLLFVFMFGYLIYSFLKRPKDAATSSLDVEASSFYDIIQELEPTPRTREELREQILKNGCDMLRGEMFLYAPCYNPRVNPGNGFSACNEDCPCFESFFKSECERFNL